MTAIATQFGAGPFIKFTRARGFHRFFLAAPNVIMAEKRARQITLPLEPVLVL